MTNCTHCNAVSCTPPSFGGRVTVGPVWQPNDVDPSCLPRGRGDGGTPADAAERELDALLAAIAPRGVAPPPGPGRVHVPSGNLILVETFDFGGPLDPRPVLQYNSCAAGSAIQFGHGWSDLFNPTLQPGSGRVRLVTGVGAVHDYTSPGGQGRYLAPADAPNALATSGSGWVETQPDGLRRHYDSTGALTRYATPADEVWTVVRDGTNPDLLARLEDPTGSRSTRTAT
jgi:hypothetical protein